MALPTQDVDLDQLDITTTARYVDQGFPWHEWDLLRERAPVYFYDRPGVPPCWVVTRYDDVKQVERRPDVFINAGPILRLDSEERLRRLAEFKGRQAARWGWDPDEPLDMVYLDRPRHIDFRTLSVPNFTRGSMVRLEADMAALAERFVAEFVAAARHAAADGGDRGDGTIDVVSGLSLAVPLATICQIIGCPRRDWTDILRWTDGLMFPSVTARYARPGEVERDTRRRLGLEYKEYLDDLIADRRARPRGRRLATALVHGTVDGAAADRPAAARLPRAAHRRRQRDDAQRHHRRRARAPHPSGRARPPGSRPGRPRRDGHRGDPAVDLAGGPVRPHRRRRTSS